MSTTTKTSVDMWHEMLTDLYKMKPPQIHADIAEPCDMDSCAEFLRDMCKPIDKFLLAFGKYMSETVPDGGFTKRQLAEHFTDQLIGALDGNATFVVEDARDHIREENFQRMHHNRHVLNLFEPRRQ